MWRLDVSSEAELEIFEAALRCERGHIGFGVRFWSTKLSFPVSIHRKSTPYGEVELEPFVHQPRRTANGESVTEVEVHAMLENATGLIVH